MPERGSLIFWIFFYFFRNFIPRAEYEQNSGLKFFSLFLGLSHPVLAKIILERDFFNFFNFFGNFLALVEYERNSGLKFFFSFSAYLIPFWLKIMSEWGVLIFWIVLLFFLEFSSPCWVWTEFGSKIFFLFFGLSHPVFG